MNPDFIQLIVLAIVVAMVVFNVLTILRNRTLDRAATEARALARRNTEALERIAAAMETRDRA